MATFSAPFAKKAIKVAQDMGLNVTGFEVLGDGTVRVMTASPAANQAETALDEWIRSQHAKG